MKIITTGISGIPICCCGPAGACFECPARGPVVLLDWEVRKLSDWSVCDSGTWELAYIGQCCWEIEVEESPCWIVEASLALTFCCLENGEFALRAYANGSLHDLIDDAICCYEETESPWSLMFSACPPYTICGFGGSLGACGSPAYCRFIIKKIYDP